jgi:hypothetical protein
MNRTAPPVHVLVDRFTVWTTAVAVLWASAFCGLVAWGVAWADPVLVGSAKTFSAFVFFGAVALVLVGFWFSRFTAVSLRWDGQQWWLGLPSDVGAEPWAVRPFVRLDFGVWMLLQLRPQGTGARLPNRHRWLPIQRSELATQWHGLRCALFTHRNHGKGLL